MIGGPAPCRELRRRLGSITEGDGLHDQCYAGQISCAVVEHLPRLCSSEHRPAPIHYDNHLGVLRVEHHLATVSRTADDRWHLAPPGAGAQRDRRWRNQAWSMASATGTEV